MSSRKERARRRNRFPALYGVCPNCGERDAHFAPPGFGSSGMFVCKHRHSARSWDGFYEHCRCGASSGDRRNPETGMRYVFFSDWPDGDE